MSAYELANAVRTDSGGGGGGLEVSLMGNLRNVISSRRNLTKEKTYLYLLCQQTFRDVDITFKIEFIWSTTWKRTKSKTWQPKMRRTRSRKSSRGPGQEKRRDSTEHWTCRQLNWVRARERRWNNTKQCHESGRVKVLGKNWNTRKNWLSSDHRTLHIDIWCATVQEDSHDFIRWPTREIKHVLRV